MKIRKREKVAPIYVREDDSIVLEYKDEEGNVTEVLEEKIGREMIITEAVIFDVEKGDFGDNVKDGIGGAFLEVESDLAEAQRLMGGI